MNKGIVVGIPIIIIAIIALVASSSNFESSDEITKKVEQRDIVVENPIEVEETMEKIVEEEVEQKGRELSIEFSETIGIKTP